MLVGEIFSMVVRLCMKKSGVEIFSMVVRLCMKKSGVRMVVRLCVEMHSLLWLVSSPM